jgi:hypothetical protein
MDSETPGIPKWISWLSKQANNPESAFNDQGEAEFQRVMKVIDAAIPDESSQIKAALIPKIRLMVTAKCAARIIADLSAGDAKREKEAFGKFISEITAEHPEISLSGADSIAKAENTIREMEVTAAVLNAEAAGYEHAIEVMIRSVSQGG